MFDPDDDIREGLAAFNPKARDTLRRVPMQQTCRARNRHGLITLDNHVPRAGLPYLASL
jgi:hypothetical protein